MKFSYKSRAHNKINTAFQLNVSNIKQKLFFSSPASIKPKFGFVLLTRIPIMYGK